MDWMPQAAPADDVTSPWWEATVERRLVVQRCLACTHAQHPPRAVCTSCGSMADLRFDEASGHGTVNSWTVVHRSPNPASTVPYTIARVELDEGVLLLTRLLGEAPWRIGEPVVVEWAPLDDGRALPVFRRTTP